MKTWAVIVAAAGSSVRMGTGRKKEFEKLSHGTVLQVAVEPFLRDSRFARIAIAFSPTDKADTEKALGGAGGIGGDAMNDGRILMVQGGSSRQQSVANALEALEDCAPDYVLIHDAARPWAPSELIERVVQGTLIHGACAPFIPAVNTMKILDSHDFIRTHLERKKTVAIQTPQGFAYAGILRAHREAAGLHHEYTDDTEIYDQFIGRVFTVPGDPKNRKITYLDDLRIDE